jgi:hypothetical protein
MTIKKSTNARWKQQERVNIHETARKDWTQVQKEHKQEDRKLCCHETTLVEISIYDE